MLSASVSVDLIQETLKGFNCQSNCSAFSLKHPKLNAPKSNQPKSQVTSENLSTNQQTERCYEPRYSPPLQSQADSMASVQISLMVVLCPTGFGLYHKPQITCNPPKAFSFDGCFCINKWNSAKLLLCVLLGISNIVPINSSSLLSGNTAVRLFSPFIHQWGKCQYGISILCNIKLCII